MVDHIISMIPNGVIHQDILDIEEVSNHNTPSYKFIHNEKTLDMNSYPSNFQQLPLNLVYSYHDSEDQVSIFNKFVVDCVNIHAPLKKVKLTRPVAPWMNDPKF